MLLTGNKTVTLVNRWRDKTTGQEVFSCHVFTGCSWRTEHEVIRSGTAADRRLVHQIRIPTAGNPSGYCEPDRYAATPAHQRSACWCFGHHAALVLGTVNPATAGEFAAIAATHTVANDLEWNDNRSGWPPHWAVKGV